jgi:exopolysaccharide production protein ExoZ
MFFYLLFAIALSFKRSTGIALLTSALLFLIVIGSGLRWLSHPPVGASMAFDLPYYFTRDIMIYFVLGILMALLRRHRRFPSVAIPVPALLGCALGTSEVVVFTLLEPDQYPAWRIGVTILVAVAAVGLCIVAAPRKQSRVTGALGDASYSIYLFHDFFLSIITSLWLRWFGKSFVTGEILSCVVLGAGGGYLVYLWVERPLSAITRRKAVRRVTTMNQSLLSIEQG